MAEHLVRWDLGDEPPELELTARERRISRACHDLSGPTEEQLDRHTKMLCALAAVACSRPPRDHRRNVRYGRAPVRLPIWQRLPQRDDHVRHVALGLPEPAAQPSAPHGPPALDVIVGGLS